MSKEIDREKSGVEQSTKPLKYEDLIRLHPYVRPWMELYLPANVFLRDLLIASVGTAAGGGISIASMLYLGSFGFYLSFVLFGLTLWFFPGEVQGRYLSTTFKFWSKQRGGNNEQ